MEHIGPAVVGLLLAALWGGCGAVLFFGVVEFRRILQLRRRGLRVNGWVVGTQIAPGDHDAVKYRVVEFTDFRGQRRRITLTQFTYDDPPVGSQMELVYDPANPDEVCGTSIAQLFLLPMVCCVLGGAGMFVGLGVLSGVLPMN